MKLTICIYVLNVSLFIYEICQHTFRAVMTRLKLILKNKRGETTIPGCISEGMEKTVMKVQRTFGNSDFKELYKSYIRSKLKCKNDEKEKNGLTNKD